MDFGGARVNVCVVGLWHLGSVTAACLAAAGHNVVGLDFDSSRIERLQAGCPPLFEPGLEDLLGKGLSEGRLHFTSSAEQAFSGNGAGTGPEFVWVAYDTPVDDDDVADVEFVTQSITRLFPYLRPGTLILISSQLPAGTTRYLEQAVRADFPDKAITFAYSPENLRLGKAIDAFTHPDRVVIGFRNELDRGRLEELFLPLKVRIEWMSVESAEMTKHALNAFLATSVTFINELAGLCEHVGADAKEVERALKSEGRIGPRAYLSPGAAFAGGTLARDVNFLNQMGSAHQVPVNLFAAVKVSNDAHKAWSRRKLMNLFGQMSGRRIAVLGLTYKVGTDTLRRSMSIELCDWLASVGAHVRAHDPVVTSLPSNLSGIIHLFPGVQHALENAEALIVGTEWPEYLQLDPGTVTSVMKSPIVLDPARFLAKTLGADPRIRYETVGKP